MNVDIDVVDGEELIVASLNAKKNMIGAMKYFKTFFRKMFDKGGVLAVGIVCLYFQRRRYVPDVFGPISYGIISVGTIAVGRHIMMDLNLSDKPRDISGTTWDCVVKEMAEKSDKLQKEHRKREILQNLHKLLTQKVKEKKSGKQPQGKEYDIFSQEFLLQMEEEMQLKPEETVVLQEYLKDFEQHMKTGNRDQGEVDRSDDSDMEIINKEEIQMISGVE